MGTPNRGRPDDIQGGGGDSAFFESVDKSVFVHKGLASGVDQYCVASHRRQPFGVDEVLVLGCCPGVKADDSSSTNELIQGDRFATRCLDDLSFNERVVNHDVCSEGRQQAGYAVAYPAETDQADLRSREFVPHEVGTFDNGLAEVYSGASCFGGTRNVAKKHHRQSNGELGNRLCVAAWGRHDRNPPFCRGGNVHVHWSAAGRADELQVWQALDDVPGDWRNMDEHRVGFLSKLDDFLGVAPVLPYPELAFRRGFFVDIDRLQADVGESLEYLLEDIGRYEPVPDGSYLKCLVSGLLRGRAHSNAQSS